MLGHAHLHELTAPVHQLAQLPARRLFDRGDVLAPLVVPGQHIGKIAQRSCIDLVGLGQNAHRLGEVPRLPRIDPCDRNASSLQRANRPSLVAAGGLDDHQVDLRGLEHRDQLAPPLRVVAQPAG